jgi:hypothetical protein
MSSKTTSPPVPDSTSTPATASTKEPAAPLVPLSVARLDKVPLRRKGATLQAVRVTHDHSVTMPDETVVIARVGDWVILSGSIIIAYLKDRDFPGPYEIVAEGTLTLSLQDRELLERTTGLGTTRTPMELVAAIQRLARIGIGDVQIPFTPGQLEEIAYRATKRGITLQRAVQDVIDRISGELFHRPS